MLAGSRGTLALVVLLLTITSVAQGQPSDPEATKSVEEQLIAAGVAFRKEGRDADALALFERAYGVRASSHALAQIALAHQALGHWCDAAADLAAALRDGDDDEWIARNRAPLEASVAAVQPHVATLDLDSNVAAAAVRVDGVSRGLLPLAAPLCVAAGTSKVDVEASGYGRIERTLETPSASVAHASFVFAIPLASLPPEPDRRPVSSRHAAGLVTLAVAGGLLSVALAGAVTGEWEARIYDDDGQCGPANGRTRDERCGTNRDIGSAARTIGVVALAGAGVAGAASAVLLLGGTSSARPARVGFRLTGAGVSCGGAF